MLRGTGSSQTDHATSSGYRTFHLDEACPIPWPSSRLRSTSSAEPREECNERGSPKGQANYSGHVAFLRKQYLQCLWLGERFYPLASFPLALDTSRKIREGVADGDASLKTAETCLDALSRLYRSPSSLQQRYRKGLPQSLEQPCLLNFLDGVTNDSTVVLGDNSEEAECILAALRSGSGSAVSAEIRDSSPQHSLESQSQEGSINIHTDASVSKRIKLRNEWLSAIERRELSLQLLLLLEALQILAQYPSLLRATGEVKSPKTSMRPPEKPSIMPLQPTRSCGLDRTLHSRTHSTSPPSTSAPGPTIHSEPLLQHGAVDDAPRQSLNPPLHSEEAAVGSPPRKRKRKSVPARRWTGMPATFGFDPGLSTHDGHMQSGFPWQSRPTKALATPLNPLHGSEDDDAVVDPGSFVRDAEKLHRLFEAFVDRLSLRIVTADLSGDLSWPQNNTGASSQVQNPQSATFNIASTFGTNARLRDERDERDELHYLCSDIVEKRYSNVLPRQCSILRTRSMTHNGGAGGTPAKLRGAGLEIAVGTNSIERERKKQGRELARLRKESDLLSRKQVVDEKNKLKEARRLSQRPHLKDALVLEEKARQGRAPSISADAERSKREVSVKSRVGFGRAASTSSATLGERIQENGSTLRTSLLSSGTANLQGPFVTRARASKRKIADPQRFGGLRKSSASAPTDALLGDEDNPFCDTATMLPPQKTLDDKQEDQLQRHVGGEAQDSGSRVTKASTLSYPAIDNELSGIDEEATIKSVPTGPWKRTESYPVTSRDISTLHSSSDVSFSTSPAVDYCTEGMEAEHESSEEEEQIFFRRHVSGSESVPSATRAAFASRSLQGLKSLRTWSKTASFANIAPLEPLSDPGEVSIPGKLAASTPKVELGLDSHQGSDMSVTVAVQPTSGLTSQEEVFVTLQQGEKAQAQDSFLSEGQASHEDGVQPQPQPSAPQPPSQRMAPLPRLGSLGRTRSGRNPFAKVVSNPQISVKAEPSDHEEPKNQAVVKDDEVAADSSDSPSELGRLWRGRAKWGME